MFRTKKIAWVLFFVLLALGASFPGAQAQLVDNYGLQGNSAAPEPAREPENKDNPQTRVPELFQWPLPDENSEIFEERKNISESTFVEEAPPAPYPKEEREKEHLREKVPGKLQPFAPREKKMVDVPGLPEKQFVDSGDFRDPFFPVRGFQRNSAKALKPGITVDGLKFFSYADSGKFVEKYYRDANFSLQDVFGKVVQLEEERGCLYCHRGIEEISSNHRFRCTQCHNGNRRAKTLPKAHEGLVANPSDLNHAGQFCGKCHADQIEKVNRSSMATAKGMINITRYAWGAQPYGKPVYSLHPDIQAREEAYPPLAGKGHPVDEFLRTKCLRCHLQGEAPHRPGDYRATGCAACHMIYGNDGQTLTHDRAIQSRQQERLAENKNIFQRASSARSLESGRGYPVVHQFTLAVPSVQCEHCHNANGVGNEYEGLLSMPARPKPSRSKVDAEKPLLYGSEHEFLAPDIHREKGMHCIDCHGVNDIKGNPASSDLHSNVEIRCEDCHGTHAKKPEEFLLVQSDPKAQEILQAVDRNPNLAKKIKAGNVILVNSRGGKMPHVKMEKNQWVLYSKVSGKKHVIPVLKDIGPPPAHQVSKHMSAMECHTCHARWSASEWGMHVIREASPDLDKWRNWSFSDPTLQQLLAGEDEKEPAVKMLDWLTAKSSANGIEGDWIAGGAWWDIVTETTWSSLILGKNERGKYSIMKPRHQYFLTQGGGKDQPPKKNAEILKTADGKPGLILLPHAPHTIRKSVRSCESCHENPEAAGLGNPLKRSIQDGKLFFSEWNSKQRLLPEFQLKQVITARGETLQTALPAGRARFLDSKEVGSLAKTSDAYRAFRYLDLRYLRFPRLLVRNEFPYDILHKANEKTYGEPVAVEDLYYDFSKNQFFASGTSLGDILEKQKQEELEPREPEMGFPEPALPEETIQAPAPVLQAPMAGQTPPAAQPELAVPAPAPLKEKTLEEEGHSIIDFFQGIFKENLPAAVPQDPQGNFSNGQ